MNVKEMIKILKQYPETTEVVVSDEFCNCDPLVDYMFEKVIIKPNNDDLD